MKTLRKYIRLIAWYWFGYDPKPQPFWKREKPDSPFLVTTKDGQAIQSESYTDKTIYERFEQPLTYPTDSKAIGTFESPRP